MNSGEFTKDIKYQICECKYGYCKTEGCLNSIHSVHHKLHNTEANRKRFPLFLSSPFNAVGLCYECHTNKSHLFKITEQEAIMYEEWLLNLLTSLKTREGKTDG